MDGNLGEGLNRKPGSKKKDGHMEKNLSMSKDEFNSHLYSTGLDFVEEDDTPPITATSDEWISKEWSANLQKGILDISHLMLKEIPDYIYGCEPTVTIVYLHDNRISTIPEYFWDKLPMLSWLDLRNNRLRMLPELKCEHKCLRVLHLNGNRLTSLPYSLALAGKLKSITVEDNPMSNFPERVVERGSAVILEYLAYQFFGTQIKRRQRILKRLGKFNKEETSTDSESEQKSVPGESASASPSGIIIDEEHRQKYAMMPEPESGDDWGQASLSPEEIKLRDQINTYMQNSQFRNPAYATPEVGRNADLVDLWYLKQASIAQDRLLQRLKDKDFIEKWRKNAQVMTALGKNKPGNSESRLIHPWEVTNEKKCPSKTGEGDLDDLVDEVKQCVDHSASNKVENSEGYEDMLQKLAKIRNKLRSTRISEKL